MAKICPIWSLCCRCELKMAEHCEENSYDLKMGAKIGTSNSNVISDLFTRFCSRVPLRCLCWISPLRFNELVSPIICERIFTKVRYRLGEKIVASYLPLHKFKKYVFIVLSDKNFLCNFRRKFAENTGIDDSSFSSRSYGHNGVLKSYVLEIASFCPSSC
jgi:hypothetical protein